ncbi:MAG: arsenosugar biosynthesis radical SAM (seleno)protein ArsS [Thermodesulfobacteriota bacterium]
MRPADQIDILERNTDLKPFERAVGKPLHAKSIEILQINVGKRCNLSCKHCHVEAGPHRTEVMTQETLQTCLEILARHPSIHTIDITGGSPEMNPNLEWFLREASGLGRRILIRSNLLILLEDSYAHFLDLYARIGAEVVGSLPAYQQGLTDRQRGTKSFERIIQAIRLLNQRGYGLEKSQLKLHLVHNPVGAFLPGAQQALEHEYRSKLKKEHQVSFNTLFNLTNCPLGRYLEYLLQTDNFQEYMQTLIQAFNPRAVEQAMCRTTLSVGWDGSLYDCDFNQMLGLQVNHGAPSHLEHFDLDQLCSRRIVLGNHCYCCTAGSGSSCQGELVE